MRILFIDTETGGLDENEFSLLSVGLVVFDTQTDSVIDAKEILINDGNIRVSPEAIAINKIDVESHVKNAVSLSVAQRFMADFISVHFQLRFVGDQIICAGHNAEFDKKFLVKNGMWSPLFSRRKIETESIILFMYHCGKMPLMISSQDAFDYFGIERDDGHHTALGDAIATTKLYMCLIELDSVAPDFVEWFDRNCTLNGKEITTRIDNELTFKNVKEALDWWNGQKELEWMFRGIPPGKS